MIAIQSSRPDDMVREIETSRAVALNREHTSTGLQENREIAELLGEIANLLADQNAGEFRVRAYRNASEKLAELSKPVREVLEAHGLPGLVELPTIGNSIANLIEQYLRMGRVPLLDRLRGNDTAEHLFSTLPIMHTDRDEHHYTAMYSNTARAHELNTTKDWVIIYRDDPKSNGRWTVITSQFGALRGRRIVRGREKECVEHYACR